MNSSGLRTPKGEVAVEHVFYVLDVGLEIGIHQVRPDRLGKVRGFAQSPVFDRLFGSNQSADCSIR